MATIPLFNGFNDGIYQYLQSDSVSDEYLLRYRDIETALNVKMTSKMLENPQNR